MLGKYLAENYLSSIPKRYIKAFLIGCTQPDKNPATYLKGSIRCHPLRGHHWLSSQKYMEKIADRLQQKNKLKFLDYYTMGKLIHYTVDAFTASHNEEFPMDLEAHRAYESHLQRRFLSYIRCHPISSDIVDGNIMDLIRHYHRSYTKATDLLSADCHYSIFVSSLVVCMILTGASV